MFTIKEEWKPMFNALKNNMYNREPFEAELKGSIRQVERLDAKRIPGEYANNGCYIYPTVYKVLFKIEGYGKVTLCRNSDDDSYYPEPAKDFYNE
jgi:hypothetical protein